ncbi:MAG: phosphatase PAP2 family protein [Anaerolineales bacterium]
MPLTILDWGIRVIECLQRGSPWLDLPVRALTLLGSAGFACLVIAVLYWSVDRHAASELGTLFLISALLNLLLKSLGQQPRPTQYDTSLTALVGASGYGLPSGHTQTIVVLAGYLAWRWPRRWLRWLCLLALLLVPLSRIYLGVHFPTDVLAGYLVGAVVLAGGLTYWRKRPHDTATSARGRVLLLCGMALAVAAPLWPAWAPSLAQSAGAALGLGLGLALERRQGHTIPKGSLGTRLRSVALGLALLGALGGLFAVLPDGLRTNPAVQALFMLCAGVLAAWGQPALASRLGLAPAITEPPPDHCP